MVTTRLTTAEDLFAMPDDGWRYELIEGVLIRLSPAGLRHGRVGRRFSTRLGAFVDERGLGEVVGPDTGFYFVRDPDTVLVPDVAFIRADRMPLVEDEIGFAPIVPDLVVEVVSPSDRPDEVAGRVKDYLGYGVPLVPVLDPTPRTANVHAPDAEPRVLRHGDVLDLGKVVPGFAVPVGDLFLRLKR